MADEEEERVLEQQLELQLHEQRESLSSLNDILTSDPSNPEVLAVHEELVLAIRDAEEGLFHLKRARLLREVDSVAGIYNPTSTSDERDVKVEPVVPDDAEAEPLGEEGQAFVVGSKCRFRHIDGRWYNGQIIGVDGGSDSAKVSFLTPTSEKMLICKFFLQQRCRFGTNCRLSHGVDIQVSSLRKFVPTSWEQSLVGSNIWALSDSGIWKEAELDTWDDESATGKVVFKDDGSCANLGVGSIALSEHASLSDEEETDSSSLDESELSEYDEDDEEEPQGLGFTSQLKGIQTETVMFAKWENHTRGIASKMMASMGYREGMGLGVSGQGMVDPIPVKVLPAKQSLELALQSEEGKSVKSKDGKGKKRSRGGRRKQDRRKSKLAEAAEADEELRRPDVFSLINSQLAIHAEKLNEGSGKKKKKGSKEKKIERRDLVAYDDEVKELRVRVEKLEEMVERNRKEKAVYEAAMRKLRETRKALADAEANHASATNSLNAKEKEKKWLKF